MTTATTTRKLFAGIGGYRMLFGGQRYCAEVGPETSDRYWTVDDGKSGDAPPARNGMMTRYRILGGVLVGHPWPDVGSSELRLTIFAASPADGAADA